MQNRTEISQIGEFGLINEIKKLFGPNKHLIGDDAAFFEVNSSLQLCSTELFIEGIHFDLAYFPLMHLGYKSVVAAISDIAAMNGLPQQIMVSVGLSNRFSVEAVLELYKGIKVACDDYNLILAGGDTTASKSGLVISVTALGTAKSESIVNRQGAQANDILCVTGDLGAAYLGLQLLEREKIVHQANPNAQPDLGDYEYQVGRQLKPTARMDIIHTLADIGIIPTAMIDLSDGLASDLKQICSVSNVGAHIFEDKLPIDDRTFLAGTSLNISPITAAMNGGEDYELLFTVKQNDYEKIKNLSDITTIGYMTTEANICELIMKSGQRVGITAQGWA